MSQYPSEQSALWCAHAHELHDVTATAFCAKLAVHESYQPKPGLLSSYVCNMQDLQDDLDAIKRSADKGTSYLIKYLYRCRYQTASYHA